MRVSVAPLLFCAVLLAGAAALNDDTTGPEPKRRRTGMDSSPSFSRSDDAASSAGRQGNGTVPVPVPPRVPNANVNANTNPVPAVVPAPDTRDDLSSNRTDQNPNSRNSNTMDPLIALQDPNLRGFLYDGYGNVGTPSVDRHSNGTSYYEHEHRRVDGAADSRGSYTRRRGGSESSGRYDPHGSNRDDRPPSSSSLSRRDTGFPNAVPHTPASQRARHVDTSSLSDLSREDLELLTAGLLARTPSGVTPSTLQTPQDLRRDTYSPRRNEGPPTEASTSRRLEAPPGPSASAGTSQNGLVPHGGGRPSVPESLRKIRRRKRKLEEDRQSLVNDNTRYTNDAMDCDVRMQERRQEILRLEAGIRERAQCISNLADEEHNLRMRRQELETESQNDQHRIQTMQENIAEDVEEKKELNAAHIDNLNRQKKISRELESCEAQQAIEAAQVPDLSRYQHQPMSRIRLAYADEIGKLLTMSRRDIENLLHRLDAGGIRRNSDWLAAFADSEWRAIFGEGTRTPHWRKSGDVADSEKRAWPDEGWTDRLRLRLASYLFCRIFRSMAELREYLANGGIGESSGSGNAEEEDDSSIE